MQRVLELIEKRTKEDMETHPFIRWLSSNEIPVVQRLRLWSPILTVFTMGFRDFNNLALTYPEEEAKDDILKASINEHTREDGTHWRWMLKDIKTLDINDKVDVVSLLHFLWGKDTEVQRKAVFDLVLLGQKAQHPLLRFCLISAFEKCGYTVFKAASELGIQYEEETGNRLYYLGKTHLDHEEGHLQCSPTTMNEEEIWNEKLSDEMYATACEIVDEVFRINHRRWHSYCTFVEGGKSWSPLVK